MTELVWAPVSSGWEVYDNFLYLNTLSFIFLIFKMRLTIKVTPSKHSEVWIQRSIQNTQTSPGQYFIFVHWKRWKLCKNRMKSLCLEPLDPCSWELESWKVDFLSLFIQNIYWVFQSSGLGSRRDISTLCISFHPWVSVSCKWIKIRHVYKTVKLEKQKQKPPYIISRKAGEKKKKEGGLWWERSESQI